MPTQSTLPLPFPKDGPQRSDALTDIPCLQCGRMFEVYASDSARRKYCSEACKWAVMSAKAQAKFHDIAPGRFCIACSAPLIRRPDETNAANFRNRKTCGGECGKQAAKLLRPALLPSEPDKTCTVCSATFSHDRTIEKHHQFRIRQTCSRACSARLTGDRVRRRVAEGKTCPVCAEVFFQRERETRGAFAKRQTCSIECRQVWSGRIRRHNKTFGTRDSQYPPEFNDELRQSVFTRDAYLCRLCGAAPGSQEHCVHHIDYIKTHCHVSNLVTLCRPCHNRTNHDRPRWQALLTAMMDAPA